MRDAPPEPEVGSGFITRLRHSLGVLMGLLLSAAVLWALHRQFSQYHYREVIQSLSSIPRFAVAMSILLVAVNYLALTGYDALALRYIGKPLAYRRTALASFVAYSLSHSLGFTPFSEASARFRLYTSWGLSATEVARVIAFCAATFWLGFAALGAADFLIEPLALPVALHLPWASARPLGVGLLALAVGYLFLSAFPTKRCLPGAWRLHLPTTRLALAQVGLASADWALAAGVLYSLLPPEAAPSYPGFVGLFLLAQVAGIASQVPGGLGVFEGAILLMLHSLPAGTVLAALLAYRGIYYLLPLSTAALLLGGHEFLINFRRLKQTAWEAGAFGRWMSALLPQVFALSAFAAGAILLLSGATPAVVSRLYWLKSILPLPVLELSHFLGSLAGMALLLLAVGLQRRVDGAYVLAIIFLAAGIALSLLKGLDYEEATILSAMLLALLPCRRYFYRKASLLDETFSRGWLAAVVLVLLGTVWLAMFVYQHVDYSDDLWWQFELYGHASRTLRATVGAVVLGVLLALARLLRPAPLSFSLPGPEELADAAAVLAPCRCVWANLALVGDKKLFFNSNHTAFVMFGVEGHSWVALRDPVGPEPELTDLAWRFRQLASRYGGWPVFYEVGLKHLPLYIDLGLTLLKLGEEGRVPLNGFTLEGSAHRSLRHTCNRVERAGCRFEIVRPEKVPALLPELKVVSDAWLVSRHTREKGFSVGFFQPDYLSRLPIAIVRQDGRLVAFANVWPDVNREELSADLMRHLPDAPNGIMDYLFTELMTLGRQEGYHWFNLGMAPFAGFEDRALAPLWTRVGSFLFRHGEHFYNFKGVREYKEKFNPVWEPRYLASPGGLALPRVLTNIAALISGGLVGVVGK